ncbi:MAG: ABC-2 transporter permease [Christensenellales bacterium]|jgi:ABC-2 type transport system permease protein
MTGLLLKDLLNLRKYFCTLALLLAVYAAIFIPTAGTISFSAVIVLLTSMVATTTFSYDDMAHWPPYALTLPITRRDLVRSKYALLFLLSAGGAVLSLLICLAAGYFMPDKGLPWSETLGAHALLLAIALFFGSVMLPLLFRFGAERARLLMILCYAAPTVLIFTGVSLVRERFPDFVASVNWDRVIEQFIWIAPVAILLLLWLSYRLSVRICQRKEY